MSYGDLRVGKGIQYLRGVYFAHESHILDALYIGTVARGDAATLLSPVLQGIKTIVGELMKVAFFLGVYTDYSALFVNISKHISYSTVTLLARFLGLSTSQPL